MDKQELDRRIQEAYGYNDYMREQYDDFQDFYLAEICAVSHERAGDKLETAAHSLEDLVRDIFYEQNQ